MNVKTLCLGSLFLRDGTGYDIKKLFEEAFSYFHSASYGSIYPSLNQLQKEGLINLRVEAGERHPDRKIYSITDAGRKLFLDELVAAEPTEQLRSEFMVQLFFAHLMPNPRLGEILDTVEKDYRKALSYLESIYDCREHTSGIRFTIGLGIASLKSQLDYIAAHRDELLSTHTAPPPAWQGETP